MMLRREPQAADPGRVAQLVARTGVFNAEEIEIARSLVGEALAQGEASGYAFLFADGPNGLEGYSCFGPIPGTERRYELYWIAVDPACQARGLAKMLLLATENAVQEQGASRIYAETSGRSAYAPAHGLYARAGYRLCAEIPHYHALDDALLIYEKVF